jgi:YD repeat-containing protein
VLVVLVLSVVLTVATVFHLRSFVRNEVYPELDKLPVITIKNHVASANVEQPWIRSFHDASSGMTTIAVIDTTGQTTGFKYDEQGLILTRTQLLVKSANNPNTPNIDLADVDDMVIDGKWVKHWADAGVWIAAGSLLVLRPIWHAGAKLLSGLLLALLGLIVASAANKRLRFGQLYSIALYALTPAIAVETVLDVVNVSIPYFFLVYYLVAGIYVGLGIRKLTGAGLAPPPPAAPTGGGFPGTIQPRNY